MQTSPFDDLLYRLFGLDAGSWFWLSNEDSAHAASFARWDPKPGKHPFMLMEACVGAQVSSRPRSANNVSKFPHPAHRDSLRAHTCESATCRIDKAGWIQRVRWPLKSRVLTADAFSCVEPNAESLIALLNSPRIR